MLVAFWKAATSFPVFFCIFKNDFFPFLCCFLFYLHLLHFENRLSAFFFFFCIFKNEFFLPFFAFCLICFCHILKSVIPFPPFFHLKFLLITIYFSGPPSHGSLFKWVPMRSLENIWTTNWWKTAHFSWVARM